MSDQDPDNDGEQPDPDEKGVCSSCRQVTPAKEMVRLSGRDLCFGCAAAFYDDEDDPG
jgi:hypothetical protein